jgi:hypothetical protein
MKAILIDPWKRSLETIDVIQGTAPEALIQLYQIVGDYLDFAYFAPGESIAVGEHSALQKPPLPRFFVDGYQWPLYGRGVVLGYHRGGAERETRLTVEELSEMIEFE